VVESVSPRVRQPHTRAVRGPARRAVWRGGGSGDTYPNTAGGGASGGGGTRTSTLAAQSLSVMITRAAAVLQVWVAPRSGRAHRRDAAGGSATEQPRGRLIDGYFLKPDRLIQPFSQKSRTPTVRPRRGRFGTLLQQLECGIFGRTAVGRPRQDRGPPARGCAHRLSSGPCAQFVRVLDHRAGRHVMARRAGALAADSTCAVR